MKLKPREPGRKCATCRHSRISFQGSLQCGRPMTAEDLVYRGIMLSIGAEWERNSADPERCGPSGQYWEAKP